MKKFFLALMVAFFMAGMGDVFAAPKVDKTLAIVNGEPIFESEFNKNFDEFKYAMFASEQLSERKINKLKNLILEKQIDEILLKNEAKKQKILVSKKEVLENIKAIKKNFANESEFNAELSKQNITPAVFEKKISELITVMKLLDNVLVNVNTKEITEAETKSFYDKVIIKMKGENTGLSPDKDWLAASVAEELKKKFGESVRIRQIFIKNPKVAAGAEAKTAQAKVETVKKELQIKSFAEIAKQYSEDIISKSRSSNGDFVIIAKGDLPLVLEKKVFFMKVGDYTKEPIKTDAGYYFIKLEEKLPNREIVFDSKVKDYINNRLLQFNKEKAYVQYIDTLKTKANIKINKVW
jgi:parvulin-like peptidyl-prolyl isomerase